jgi:hypothetical protein
MYIYIYIEREKRENYITQVMSLCKGPWELVLSLTLFVSLKPLSKLTLKKRDNKTTF